MVHYRRSQAAVILPPRQHASFPGLRLLQKRGDTAIYLKYEFVRKLSLHVLFNNFIRRAFLQFWYEWKTHCC